MKYQGFITERKDGDLALRAEYRSYYIPVEERDGGWFPAGKAVEDTDSNDQVGLLSTVLNFQINRPNDGCGPLDDLASPDGHTIVARYWLEDDYVPPTAEQIAAKIAEAQDKLRSMGLWKEPND